MKLISKFTALCIGVFALCLSAVTPVKAADVSAEPTTPAVASDTPDAGQAPAAYVPYSGLLATAPQLDPEWFAQRVLLTDGYNEWSFPLSDLAQTQITITPAGASRTLQLMDTSYISNFIVQANKAYETIPTQGTETIYQRSTDTCVTASTGMFLQIRREFAALLTATIEQQLAQNPVPSDIFIDLNGGYLVGYPVGGRIITAGTCTTSLSTSSSNRISNVSLAASHINNVVLMPGEEISISTAILPRTSANGYKEAGVYLNGETVQGIGGGICQLSSTTYNAAITSGLTILERHPHSMPIHYLNLGLDAAISSGSKDLRFRNDYDLPVTIMAGVENKRLTVSICMNEYLLDGKTYKLWSTVPSHNVAKTYLSTYVDGLEVSQVYVGTSRYSDPKPKQVNED